MQAQKPVATSERSKSKLSVDRNSSVLALWLTVLIAFIWIQLTSCMCRYTSLTTSIVIIPAFCYALYAFMFKRRSGIVERMFGAVAFALVTLMLIKNVTDILWFRHGAFLN